MIGIDGGVARAQDDPEQELADRYAPIMMLKAQDGECDEDGEPYAEVQKVAHPSRVHLDIETDDIEAEVARLEKLGAKRLEAIRDWVVMEAPTGQRFCVVPVVRGGFDAKATTWES